MDKKNKTQINEMTEVIEHTRRLARDVVGTPASSKMIATDLHNKGYRKSTEVAEEIFAEIEKLMHKQYNRSLFGIVTDITPEIAALKKKYIGKDTNVPTKESEDTE